MCRKRPYEGLNQLQVMQAITQGGLPEFVAPPQQADIAEDGRLRVALEWVCDRCWNLDPANRPSMEVLQDWRGLSDAACHEEGGPTQQGASNEAE